jgi:hypothetical protein
MVLIGQSEGSVVLLTPIGSGLIDSPWAKGLGGCLVVQQWPLWAASLTAGCQQQCQMQQHLTSTSLNDSFCPTAVCTKVVTRDFGLDCCLLL